MVSTHAAWNRRPKAHFGDCGFPRRHQAAHAAHAAVVVCLLLQPIDEWMHAYIYASCRAADEDIKPHDIYPFDSPRDVEIASRTLRVWVDRYTLDKEATMQAEAIIKVCGTATCGGMADGRGLWQIACMHATGCGPSFFCRACVHAGWHGDVP